MSNKMDNLLREWAARKAPKEEQLNCLADRIRSETARTRYADHQATRDFMPFWSKLGYARI